MGPPLPSSVPTAPGCCHGGLCWRRPVPSPPRAAATFPRVLVAGGLLGSTAPAHRGTESSRQRFYMCVYIHTYICIKPKAAQFCDGFMAMASVQRAILAGTFFSLYLVVPPSQVQMA